MRARTTLLNAVRVRFRLNHLNAPSPLRTFMVGRFRLSDEKISRRAKIKKKKKHDGIGRVLFRETPHSFLIPSKSTTVVVTASEAKINKIPIFRGKYAYNNDIGSEKKQRPRRDGLPSRGVLFCLSLGTIRSLRSFV